VDRRLNLLFLRDTTFVCGPGKTILNTYRTLDLSRFSLTVGVPTSGSEPNGFIDQAESLGIRVRRLPVKWSIDPAAVIRLARLLRRERVDIVQSHDSLTRRLALPAAALARVPHVTSVHGWITNTRKESLAKPVDLALIRRARRVVAVSGRLRDEVVSSGCSPDRVLLLRNAILLDDYPVDADTVEARKALGLLPDGPVVSIVGRLSPEKGHMLFLAMARTVATRIPSARFLIVGHGPQRATLEAHSRALSLERHVSFLGLRADMRRIYAATAVLTLCSSTEGMPNVVLEAFAHSRPVVATRVGGVPEIVTHGVDGYVIEQRVDALVEATTRLLLNPSLREEMGQRGRKKIEDEFDFRRRTSKLESLYRSLARADARP
jgi:glycosyltransferase involved in cell wall biosynthesis